MLKNLGVRKKSEVWNIGSLIVPLSHKTGDNKPPQTYTPQPIYCLSLYSAAFYTTDLILQYLFLQGHFFPKITLVTQIRAVLFLMYVQENVHLIPSPQQSQATVTD